MIRDAAKEVVRGLGQSRRLSESLKMGLITASGLLLAGPAATVSWDQCCWVAAEPCAAPISLSPCLWHFWFGAHSCRVDLASLAICHPGISLYVRNRSLPAGVIYLLCPHTCAVHIFNGLAPTAPLPVWEVWFHLGSSRPCDTDLRVDEHEKTICILNGRVFGAG